MQSEQSLNKVVLNNYRKVNKMKEAFEKLSEILAIVYKNGNSVKCATQRMVVLKAIDNLYKELLAFEELTK